MGRPTTSIICAWCEQPCEKASGEVNRSRKLGRRLFCSRTCCAKNRNHVYVKPTIQLTCPCGRAFETTTKRKASKHCSRECASGYHVTDRRRRAAVAAGHAHAGNLISAQALLLQREQWKYRLVADALQAQGRRHEFEYAIGNRIFDLALLDEKVVIEFDGPDHRHQISVDALRDAAARAAGFTIMRMRVEPNTVIDPSVVRAAGGLRRLDDAL